MVSNPMKEDNEQDRVSWEDAGDVAGNALDRVSRLEIPISESLVPPVTYW